MEWNWFYSSVTQSSAAIVGIFAAFAMTKIINNQSDFARKRFILKQYVVQSKRLLDKARSSPISRYNEDVFIREVMKVCELLKKNQMQSPEQAINILRFSEFADKQHMKAKFEGILQTCRHRGMLSGSNLRDSFLKYNADKYTEEESNRLQEEISRNKTSIYEVLTDVKDHIRTIRVFLDSISGNPESSWLLRYILIGMLLLFWICVVYPLCLLPNTNDNTVGIICFLNKNALLSSKGLMLAALGLIFTLLFGVMGYANEALKYDSSQIKELQGYLDVAAYSESYIIQDHNEI
jgi:hypothetical protein